MVQLNLKYFTIVISNHYKWLVSRACASTITSHETPEILWHFYPDAVGKNRCLGSAMFLNCIPSLRFSFSFSFLFSTHWRRAEVMQSKGRQIKVSKTCAFFHWLASNNAGIWHWLPPNLWIEVCRWHCANAACKAVLYVAWRDKTKLRKYQ